MTRYVAQPRAEELMRNDDELYVLTWVCRLDDKPVLARRARAHTAVRTIVG